MRRRSHKVECYGGHSALKEGGSMADYDAIAIGGGLTGAAFARELAGGGARIAIVERTPGRS